MTNIDPWNIAVFAFKTYMYFMLLMLGLFVMLTPIGWIGYAIYYFINELASDRS